MVITARGVGGIRPWVDLARIHLSEPSSSDGMRRSWIMYMPEGRFEHPDYGSLDFTPAKLSEFKQRFDSKVRGIDIALDCDHKTGEAPGWIEQMQLRDGSDGQPAGLYALIRWTTLGEKLLKEQLYKYFSPEFGTHFDERTGKKISNVPLGGALTNRPFLKSMTAVALAESSGGVSHRSWGSVDKACLPDSAFLDPKNRRLPVYEGAGPKDAKGRYTQRGPLNLNGVRAALAAVHGARSGSAMTGLPAGVAAKLQRWLKQYDGGDGGDESKATSEHARRASGGEQIMPVDYLDPEDEAAFALADASADDEESYDDGDGDADDGSNDDNAGGSSDSFDAKSDTHGAMDTDGHSHGKYGKHGHDGDGDHSDAPMKMSEQSRTRAGADKPRTLSEARVRLVELEARMAELSEQQYLSDVKEQMASFDRTFKFDEAVIASPTQDPKGGQAKGERSASVTPSRRLRRGLEAFLLSETARGMSKSERAGVLKLVQLAYEHGAVPLTSLALSETESQPKRTVVAPGTARRRPETGADALKLAEAKAQQRYNKPLSALSSGEKALVLAEAASEAGYAGAERY